MPIQIREVYLNSNTTRHVVPLPLASQVIDAKESENNSDIILFVIVDTEATEQVDCNFMVIKSNEDIPPELTQYVSFIGVIQLVSGARHIFQVADGK